MLALVILFWINVFDIVWAMVGYPVFLTLIDKALKIPDNPKNKIFEPTVTIMVVAHNEEKIIKKKLENLLQLDYPQDKLSIVVASDFCTDRTDSIVEQFINDHPDRNIRIHKSEKHLGKTNAQNETQKMVASEILVMTDANAMLEPSAVRELASSFTAPDIVYVSGQLKYKNEGSSSTSSNEGLYWKMDLKCREIESKIKTITAGNGAIYAVRNNEYVDIPPIECHDSAWPIIFGLQKKRAIYNKDAIAYEKAGEVDKDEFKRKVRMNREILKMVIPDPRILNGFKYRWFSFFYLGHRTCRYLLWLAHTLAFVVNIPLAINGGIFWKVTMALQTAFYIVALIGKSGKINNRLVKLILYYVMTIAAQWKGVINEVTGKSKPVWDKAESTR